LSHVSNLVVLPSNASTTMSAYLTNTTINRLDFLQVYSCISYLPECVNKIANIDKFIPLKRVINMGHRIPKVPAHCVALWRSSGGIFPREILYLGSGDSITYTGPLSAPDGKCSGVDCSGWVWMTTPN
jgi:hypothetical protein